MPLVSKVIVRGDSLGLQAQEDINVKTIKVTDLIDLKRIQIDGHPDLKQIWVNPDDSAWSYYYTKKQVDALLLLKEDKIQFVYLEQESGYIDEDVWNYIIEHPVTKIICNEHIFDLYSNNNEWVYQSINATEDKIELISINPFDHSYQLTRKSLVTAIQMNTTEGWNSNPSFISQVGIIYCYTDYSQYQKDGRTIIVPGIKVGSGAYLIDEPFINQDVYDFLYDHIRNESIHVSPQDRQRWDSKLNYKEPTDDLLIFTRE